MVKSFCAKFQENMSKCWLLERRYIGPLCTVTMYTYYDVFQKATQNMYLFYGPGSYHNSH